MTDAHTIEVDVQRARAEAAAALAAHELTCERRYGELTREMAKLAALHGRNTRLLYVLLGGMLAVAGRSFWPGLFGG